MATTTTPTTGNKTETKKSKKFTYHKTHSFEVATGKEAGTKVRMTTQLYKIGVYGIINDQSSMQGSYTPQQMVKIERSLKKDEQKGLIKNLQFGSSITVTDETGFWEEVID